MVLFYGLKLMDDERQLGQDDHESTSSHHPVPEVPGVLLGS